MNVLSTAAARTVAVGVVFFAATTGWAAAQTIPSTHQDLVDANPLAAAAREVPLQASANSAVATTVEARVRAVREITTQGEMVTDRPDYTESSLVVPRGGFQFESGLVFEGDVRDGVRGRNLTVPSSLLRIGLTPRMELRIGGDGVLVQAAGGASTTGYSDLELGVKLRLLDAARAGFDLAVIPMVSFPTGTTGFSSGAVDPTVKVTWARDLPAGFSASGNFNASSISDELGRYTQRAVSVSFGHDLAGGWGGFLETYAFTPMERGEGNGVTFDTGISRSIGRDFQVDLEAGRGLTAASPDWFFGCGISMRGWLSRHH